MTHPKGLYLLFFTEAAERFSYYGMRALFTLYIISAFFNKETASQVYGSYTGLVYLTPLLGGYISDRYWGNRRSIVVGGLTMALGQFLLFLSACTVQQTIFSEGAPIDASIDNSLSLTLLFLGIGFLTIGNGFFKPNIATMVGDLYPSTDTRKDSAFTIFYMGINVGAFFAPLWCGFVGEGNWADLAPFKWGFLSACIAMLLSVAIFSLLKNRYLVTPDGKTIGGIPKRPKQTQTTKISTRSIIYIALAILLFIAFSIDNQGTTVTFASDVSVLNSISSAIYATAISIPIIDYISSAIYAAAITIPIFIITDRTLEKIQKQRIAVIYIIAIFVIFFWAAFEQAGITLTYFASEQTNRNICGWEMPASWFQAFNPIFVVTLAPLMATLWSTLNKRNREPSSPQKQALGLLLLSLGYLVITFGVKDVQPGVRVSILWLTALYFIHTVGELSLSPIGLSMVNKLAPKHLASLLMGVWFMSMSVSNILTGRLATLYPEQGVQAKSFLGCQIATMSDFFLIFVCLSAVASVALFALSPLLKKLMNGVE